MKKFFLGVAVASMLAACGGGDSSAGSCSQSSGGSTQLCTDYGAGYTASSVMQSCSSGSGETYSAEACTATNRVGRCTISNAGGSVTQNYYAPFTAAQVMMTCTAGGGTYTAD